MERRGFLKLLPVLVATVWGARLAPAVAHSQEKFPYAMEHVAGGVPCWNLAAYMTENPAVHSLVKSSQFRKLDGSRFVVSNAPICGSCGGRFMPVRHGFRVIRGGLHKL